MKLDRVGCWLAACELAATAAATVDPGSRAAGTLRASSMNAMGGSERGSTLSIVSDHCLAIGSLGAPAAGEELSRTRKMPSAR